MAESGLYRAFSRLARNRDRALLSKLHGQMTRHRVLGIYIRRLVASIEVNAIYK
jgi:hypothetical protein